LRLHRFVYRAMLGAHPLTLPDHQRPTERAASRLRPPAAAAGRK
jgi:hypothetical protein